MSDSVLDAEKYMHRLACAVEGIEGYLKQLVELQRGKYDVMTAVQITKREQDDFAKQQAQRDKMYRRMSFSCGDTEQ